MFIYGFLMDKRDVERMVSLHKLEVWYSGAEQLASLARLADAGTERHLSISSSFRRFHSC
jgi:hypothetical protein